MKVGDQYTQIHDTLAGWPETKHVRVWDLASTVKQRSGDDPDYTCGSLGTVTFEHDPATGAKVPHLWIRDCKFCREEAPKRNSIIKKTAEEDGPSIAIKVENYGPYKDACAELKLALKGLRSVQGVKMKGDKLVKASPLEPIFEAGNVHLHRGPWNARWLQQHSDFTGIDGASHDDSVDCSSLILDHFTGKSSGLAMPGLQ